MKFAKEHPNNYRYGTIIMWEIDEVLNSLKAGEWRGLQEVISGCSMPECATRLVLKFMNQFDFIQVDEEEKKVKLNPAMTNLINQTI